MLQLLTRSPILPMLEAVGYASVVALIAAYESEASVRAGPWLSFFGRCLLRDRDPGTVVPRRDRHDQAVGISAPAAGAVTTRTRRFGSPSDDGATQWPEGERGHEAFRRGSRPSGWAANVQPTIQKAVS